MKACLTYPNAASARGRCALEPSSVIPLRTVPDFVLRQLGENFYLDVVQMTRGGVSTPGRG